MDRRSFFRLSALGLAATTLPLVLPDPEPHRRWWHFGWQPARGTESPEVVDPHVLYPYYRVTIDRPDGSLRVVESPVGPWEGIGSVDVGAGERVMGLSIHFAAQRPPATRFISPANFAYTRNEHGLVTAHLLT